MFGRAISGGADGPPGDESFDIMPAAVFHEKGARHQIIAKELARICAVRAERCIGVRGGCWSVCLTSPPDFSMRLLPPSIMAALLREPLLPHRA